jgi:uncharacterized protein (TIGR00369 family)
MASLFDIAALKHHWNRVRSLPGGRALFSRAIGLMAPYSGTIGAKVQDLSPGHAVVSMRDRRAVRNHLRSVHAVALANLAEMTGNLALAAALPDDGRMIPVQLTIDYLKKARGTITATASSPVPETSAKQELVADVRMENPAGELVARATVKCAIGPRKEH